MITASMSDPTVTKHSVLELIERSFLPYFELSAV